jgi:hypothetical protein
MAAAVPSSRSSSRSGPGGEGSRVFSVVLARDAPRDKTDLAFVLALPDAVDPADEGELARRPVAPAGRAVFGDIADRLCKMPHRRGTYTAAERCRFHDGLLSERQWRRSFVRAQR